MDSHKLNQLVAPIIASVPMWFSCLNRSTHHLVPGSQLVIWQMHFSPYLSDLSSNRRNLVSAGKANLSVLLQGHISSQTLCHNLDHRDLHCLSLPQSIILAHHIDDIMLIEQNNRETASILFLLVKHVYICGWEINPTKFQGSWNVYGPNSVGQGERALLSQRISCFIGENVN